MPQSYRSLVGMTGCSFQFGLPRASQANTKSFAVGVPVKSTSVTASAPAWVVMLLSYGAASIELSAVCIEVWSAAPLAGFTIFFLLPPTLASLSLLIIEGSADPS